MIEITRKENCSGCYSCVNACPKKCIQMEQDKEGFWYPVVDKKECIDCGICESRCPIITSRKIDKTIEDISTYGAVTNNEEVRLKSSSGGVFTEIATYVINNGGVVFGAAFDEDFQVFHKHVSTIEEIDVFRGSKYVQSKVGETYKEVEKYLDAGKLVLFTGTPCQIGGLYSYLKGDRDNLITQDIICHGVPSPMVWNKYLEYRRKRAHCDSIQHISFKDKITGWKTYSMSIQFENHSNYTERSYKDPMMKAFIGNYCLRPSCHACSFKGKVRSSDITLADFWGADKMVPSMDDNKGLSLVFINSIKGKKVFNCIENYLTMALVNMDEAVKFNSSMIYSAKAHRDREAFLKKVREKGFGHAARKYLKDPFVIRLKRGLKRVMKR